MSGRRKIASALFVSLLTGLVALQMPSVSPVGAADVTGTWEALGDGISDGTVFQIVRSNDGTLFAGGTFTGAVASLATTSASTWQTLTGGPTVSVYSLGLDEQSTPSRLYVGGDFASNGGGLARVEPSTGIWTDLGDGTPQLYDGDGVERMTILDPTQVYIGGSFTDANGISATQGLARLNNTTFTAVGGGVSVGTSGARRVNALANHDGMLYVGGQFGAVSGSAVVGWRIASFDPTASAWSAFGASNSGPYRSADPLVAAIAVQDTSNIFIGGRFDGVRNLGVALDDTRGLAKWNGTAWTSIGSVNTTGVVEELRVIGDYLYAGGNFDSIGGVDANHIARMELSTGTWEPLVSDCQNGVNGVVRSIIDAGDDAIYVAGAFTNAGGVAAADRVAKFTPGEGGSGSCGVGGGFRPARPMIAAPKNLRIVSAQDGVRQDGRPGMLVTLAWDAAPQYFGYLVSVEKVRWAQPAQNVFVLDVLNPITGLACYTEESSCQIHMPYSSSGGFGLSEARFTLKGNSLYGRGTPISIDPPRPDSVVAPSAPLNVTAEAGWKTVTVSWEEPANRGSYPIGAYLVRSSPADRICITRPTDLNPRTCTLRNLTPGTQYTFTVQALNGAGWGEVSAPSNATSRQDVVITKQSRNRVRFLFINRGSDISVEGQAPGIPAGTVLNAFVKYNNSTQWVPVGEATVQANGSFTWKRRFPANQDRDTIAVTFTFRMNQSDVVTLGPVR